MAMHAATETNCFKAIVLLCGLPASGKTTLAQTLHRIWQRQKLPNVSVISIDALQTEQSFSPSDWHTARDKAFELVAEAVKRERALVMVDDTMFYRSMRRKYFALAADMDAAFVLVHVTCPVKRCLQRNAKREGRRIPDAVIQHAGSQFEPPDGSKFNWERGSFVFDSEQCDPRLEPACAEIADKMLRSWTAARKEERDTVLEQQQRQLSNLSAMHQLDLQIRGCISQAMEQKRRDGDPNALSAIAKHLNHLRKQSLAAFKVESCQKQAGSSAVEDAVKAFVKRAQVRLNRDSRTSAEDASLALCKK